MSKENKRPSVQVGGSTILMIFTVLCLTVFAVLSLSTAKADYTLSQKAEASATAYYAADSQAEEMLVKIDKILKSAVAEETEQAYDFFLEQNLGELYDIDGKYIAYNVSLSEGQILSVKLKPIYSADQRFKITEWVVKNTGEYEIDESINVWLGE